MGGARRGDSVRPSDLPQTDSGAAAAGNATFGTGLARFPREESQAATAGITTGESA